MQGSSLDSLTIGLGIITGTKVIGMRERGRAIEIEDIPIDIEMKGIGTGPIEMIAIGGSTNIEGRGDLLLRVLDLTARHIGIGGTIALNLGQRVMTEGMDTTATAGDTMKEKAEGLLLEIVIDTEISIVEEEKPPIPARTLALVPLVDDMDTKNLIINGWR
jgi:hypothetical protein